MMIPLLDEMVRDAASIAIAGHIRPDGDCVGSCLAVYNYITENYPQKTCRVYLDHVPERFRFLPHADQQGTKKDQCKRIGLSGEDERT